MIDYRYAYFIGSLITVVIWIYLFIRGKHLRKEMLILSFATMILAPTNILYYGHYWRPEFIFNLYNFGIESIIVCFTYGGICGVIYESIFNKTGYKKRGLNLHISKIQLFLSGLAGIIVMLLLEIFTPLNIIYTSSTALLIVSVFFILFRKDLLISSLLTGGISLILSLIVYWILLIPFPEFIDRVWIPETISNIRILLIPIEEYFFHFALGMCLGAMYEVAYGESDRKRRKK